MAAVISTATQAVSWKQILVLLPEVAKAAKGIWKQWDSKPKPEPIDPNASINAQVAAIAKRIEALEANEKNQSEVVSQIAEQLQGLAAGLKETSARLTLLMWLSISALALSTCALVVAFNA